MVLVLPMVSVVADDRSVFKASAVVALVGRDVGRDVLDDILICVSPLATTVSGDDSVPLVMSG